MDVRDIRDRRLVISGKEERTASLSSCNLGISSRTLGSRGQIKQHLYDWEKISYAVSRYNYYKAEL